MAMILTEEKKTHIEKLIRSFRELDGAMLPFKEQKKELKESYTKSNEWLTEEEYKLCVRAYNALKKRVDFDDLSTIVDVVKREFPTE